ncbi:hypothetical protein C7H19_17825 [Aphanothece hegewaldii CCALA 016]|uniref:Uncharacterized protein n=1 Tax=Aphanothece hegewaldii CCALA 016 TaxID=2107694 RepID=A0A2T1LU65_9CHRO|nr:hypothetical protein C7H19_17825 [Aphanothece hegewaldii CCALA 016]
MSFAIVRNSILFSDFDDDLLEVLKEQKNRRKLKKRRSVYNTLIIALFGLLTKSTISPLTILILLFLIKI